MQTATMRVLLALAPLCLSAARASAPGDPPLVIFGDPQPHTATVWSRQPGATTMHVHVRLPGSTAWRKFEAPVTAANDYSARLVVKGLLAGTTFEYELWFTGGTADARAKVSGHLHTAASEQSFVPVHFAWGGDLAGENICRDAVDGFPVFAPLGREKLDFFVALGDMIYADDPCLARGQLDNAQVAGAPQAATRLDEYWQKWRYARADASLAAFLGRQPYVAVWDDHEVVNNFGPGSDTRSDPPYTPGEHLMPIGLKAYIDENPLIADAAKNPKLYRTFYYGLHAQLFVLDCRQYRSPDGARDLASAPKSMLGAEQLAWFEREIGKSKATWKIIVTSVPLALMTGSSERGLDGWANFDTEYGYERELHKIVEFLHEHRVRNVVWLTTDVHFAAGFHYRPIEADQAWEMYEFASGPLNAQSFPKQTLDTSFNPDRLFFFGPSYVGEPKTWAQAKRWFNYGQIDIDRTGILTVSIRDIDGQAVRQLKLAPRRK